MREMTHCKNMRVAIYQMQTLDTNYFIMRCPHDERAKNLSRISEIDMIICIYIYIYLYIHVYKVIYQDDSFVP